MAGMWSDELGVSDRLPIFRKRLEELLAISDQVIVVGQVPLIEIPLTHNDSLRKFLVANYLSNQFENLKQSTLVEKANSDAERVIREIASDRLSYVNPTALFTNSQGGPRLVDDREVFLYSDYHHINDSGAKLLFEALILPLLPQIK